MELRSEEDFSLLLTKNTDDNKTKIWTYRIKENSSALQADNRGFDSP